MPTVRNMELLSINAVYEIIGVSVVTIRGKWKDMGLKIQRLGRFNRVDRQDLIDFMVAHQDLWRASRVKDPSFFDGMDWFQEKLETERNGYHWSRHEISILKNMYSRGCPITEISETLGRTYGATYMKLENLRNDGWRVRGMLP